MVPKLAQAIASGDVPDLMGLDLIYGPQFASAGQLEDITDLIGDDPLLETLPEGHRDVATYDDRLYGVPLYADLPGGRDIDALRVDPSVTPRNDGDGVVVAGRLVETEDRPWPYGADDNGAAETGEVDVPLVPYHTWANRGPSTMRVWIPTI
jgi:multiple sugar transport system substrate-binding protein